MKVARTHLLRYSSFFAAHAVCGRTEWNGEILIVSRDEWQTTPLEARCRGCAKKASP